MDASMEDLAKKEQQSLLFVSQLSELSHHAAVLGNLGSLYHERYLHKGEYRDKDAPETGYQWVMRCFNRPRYFYDEL
jgi:hypothetical protein